MIIAIIPVLVALAGLLLYLMAAREKIVEIGRIIFFVGVLWMVYTLATKTVRIGALAPDRGAELT